MGKNTMTIPPTLALLAEVVLALVAAAAIVLSAIITVMGGLLTVWLKYRLEQDQEKSTTEE